MESATQVFTSGSLHFTLSKSYAITSNSLITYLHPTLTAREPVSNLTVTITKIPHPLSDLLDLKRLLYHIKILSFCDHPNIVSLVDVPVPPSDWSEVYYMQEAMDTDLGRIIQSSQPLSERYVAYLMYQLLKAFMYLHSADITVKYLTPEHIRVNANCQLKIGQFYVPSYGDGGEISGKSWYYSPELLLEAKLIDNSTDMWIAGCILAELLIRHPLFPYSGTLEQIRHIISFLGTPSQEDTVFITHPSAWKFLSKLPTSPPVSWQSKFPNSSAEALQLISGLLVLNPEKRLTVTQCLELPFFNEYRCVEDEIEASECFDWSWDEEEVAEDTLKKWVLEAAQRFHPMVDWEGS